MISLAAQDFTTQGNTKILLFPRLPLTIAAKLISCVRSVDYSLSKLSVSSLLKLPMLLQTEMSDFCEDPLFRNACLPIVSLLTVTSLTA